MKQIDSEAIRFHIRGILEALGDDPDREGLKETPDRVARMYEEVFEGMKYSNDEIAYVSFKIGSSEGCGYSTGILPCFLLMKSSAMPLPRGPGR